MFYLKMKGDYYRYLSEVASGEVKTGKWNVKFYVFVLSILRNVQIGVRSVYQYAGKIKNLVCEMYNCDYYVFNVFSY